MSSRFVDKWEESGELRSRLVSRGYESSQLDLASLFAATPSVTATRIALVLGLAQDVEMVVADISGAFLHSPPVEYRKPSVVWKVKRYLYGDKRAPRGWQNHLEKTMLDFGFERLESEPSCFVKNRVSHKDTIIVVVHVDDLLSVGKRRHLDNFFVQLETTLKFKRVEYIENGKSVLFLGNCITKVQGQDHSQEQGYVCGQHARDAGHGELQADKHTDGAIGVGSKRRGKNAGRIRGRDVSVSCRHLDAFQETPFRFTLRGKVSGNGEFLADQGSHETFETSFALHSRHARHASGICSAPRTVDGIGWLV